MAEKTCSRPYVWLLKRIKYDGEFQLRGGNEYSIGRNLKSSLPIKSAVVSKEHCILKENEDSLVIKDLNSSNGTFVNDKCIPNGQEIRLKSGCTIGLGVRYVSTEDDFMFRVVRLKEEPDFDEEREQEAVAEPENESEGNNLSAEGESLSIKKVFKEEEKERGKENRKREVQRQPKQMNERNRKQEKEKSHVSCSRIPAECSDDSDSPWKDATNNNSDVSDDSARTKKRFHSIVINDSSSEEWSSEDDEMVKSHLVKLERKIKISKSTEMQKMGQNRRNKCCLEKEQNKTDIRREASRSQKTVQRKAARAVATDTSSFLAALKEHKSLKIRNCDEPLERMQPVVRLCRVRLQDVMTFSRDLDELLSRGTKSRKRFANSPPARSVSREPPSKVVKSGTGTDKKSTMKNVKKYARVKAQVTASSPVMTSTRTLNEPESAKTTSRSVRSSDTSAVNDVNDACVLSDITKFSVKTCPTFNTLNSSVVSSPDSLAVCSSAAHATCVNAKSIVSRVSGTVDSHSATSTIITTDITSTNTTAFSSGFVAEASSLKTSIHATSPLTMTADTTSTVSVTTTTTRSDSHNTDGPAFSPPFGPLIALSPVPAAVKGSRLSPPPPLPPLPSFSPPPSPPPPLPPHHLSFRPCSPSPSSSPSLSHPCFPPHHPNLSSPVTSPPFLSFSPKRSVPPPASSIYLPRSPPSAPPCLASSRSPPVLLPPHRSNSSSLFSPAFSSSSSSFPVPTPSMSANQVRSTSATATVATASVSCKSPTDPSGNYTLCTGIASDKPNLNPSIRSSVSLSSSPSLALSTSPQSPSHLVPTGKTTVNTTLCNSHSDNDSHFIENSTPTAPAVRKPVQRLKKTLMCYPRPMAPKYTRVNSAKSISNNSTLCSSNASIATTSGGNNNQLDKEQLKLLRKEKLKQLAESQKKPTVERSRVKVHGNIKVTGKSRADKLLEQMMSERSETSQQEAQEASEEESLFDLAQPQVCNEEASGMILPVRKLSFRDLEKEKETILAAQQILSNRKSEGVQNFPRRSC